MNGVSPRNGNFFIFLRRHIARAYMHVFLLTLREVMNNFEAPGEVAVSERRSEGGRE